jgi:phosphate starvation-inducible PhoH-like protein
LSQIDLPHHQKSGLRQAMDILDGVDGIAVMTLTAEDVVRHRLVKEIIKAYDKIENEERIRREQRKREREAAERGDTEAPGAGAEQDSAS